MLPCLTIFFRNFILIWKFQKWSLNRGTLVPTTGIYQTKCPFAVISVLFCSSRCCPMILDYSLDQFIFFLLFLHCKHLCYVQIIKILFFNSNWHILTFLNIDLLHFSHPSFSGMWKSILQHVLKILWQQIDLTQSLFSIMHFSF